MSSKTKDKIPVKKIDDSMSGVLTRFINAVYNGEIEDKILFKRGKTQIIFDDITTSSGGDNMGTDILYKVNITFTPID